MSAVIQWAYPAREPIAYVTAVAMSVLALWLISQQQVAFNEDKYEFLTSLESTPPPQPAALPKVVEHLLKPMPAPAVPHGNRPLEP